MTKTTLYNSTEIFQQLLKQTVVDLNNQFSELYVERNPELIGSALIAHATIFASDPPRQMTEAEYSQLKARLDELKEPPTTQDY